MNCASVFDILVRGCDDGGAVGLVHEGKATLRLALPLVIGQLSQMLLGVADTVMVGALGVTELAALTFVNVLFWVPLVFGIGVLTSVSVFSSNALGAQDADLGKRSCRYGLMVSLLLGLVLFLLSFPLVRYLLPVFGQPDRVAILTGPYFIVVMASGIPCLASLALKNHADAMNRPWPPFWIFLAGVVANVGLNALLIHGYWGFPELGMMGAAWATLICRWGILIGMMVWMRADVGLRDWVPSSWLGRWKKEDMLAHARVGFPASIHMLCEVLAFSMAGIMMGWLGEVPMAAHQVAVTCAGVAFMVPLGLSMALTVRVGESYGAMEWVRMKKIIVSGWGLAGVLGLLNASVFLLFGGVLAGGFTDAAPVVALSASLLAIVGVFQIVDGMQVASAAMLRGIHDTKITAWLGLVSYWLIGVPVAYMLGVSGKGSAEGVWWGLALGLMVACLGLGYRLWRKFAKMADQER